MTLFQHPEQLAELKADPAKWVGPFVEELCRYHTASAMAIKRTAKEDIEIGGQVTSPRSPDCRPMTNMCHAAAHQGRPGNHRVEPVGQP